MAKEILYDDDARNGLAAGIHKLSNAVKVTLGPRGRYVALQGPRRSPTITNDGVTVAKSIQLKNQVENMGARMVREAAIRTNDIAGDGTTTATLLCDVIVTEGLRLIAAGADALSLRRGIEKAVKAVVAAMNEDAREVKTKDEIRNIAFISSGDETIADAIATAVDAMGSTGGITCKDGSTYGIDVEIVEGIRYDEGFILHSMVTDVEHNIAELENPLILITDQELMSIQPLIPLLEQVVQSHRDLFIISNDVRGEARRTIMLNTERGTFRTVATECPDFNEQRKALLADIACATGATPILEEFGFNWPDVTIDMLGSADLVRCTANSTVILGGHGDPKALQERIDTLQREMDRTVNPEYIEKMEQRMQKLRGGVAIIRIGAASDAELKETKSRVEDALCAVTAAMDEGILPGGGVALVNAARALDDLDVPADEQLGVDIVRKACMAPLDTIARNCGYEGPVEIDMVQHLEKGQGRDYKTGEVGDMVEMGVIDPVLVTRYALEAAASVGCLVLITETTANKLLEDGEVMPDEPLHKTKGVMRM